MMISRFPDLLFFSREQNGGLKKSEGKFIGINSGETSIESLGLRWKLLECF